MDEVHVLHHSRMLDEEEWLEDVKFIGVYSSREKAEAAIERLSKMPGFRDTPERFCIEAYPLDKDHWAEGYVTE